VTLQAGTLFAGYQIDRLLGVGGMGEVYLARHPNLPRHDALKVLAENLSDNPEYRARFLEEANLACRLRHPNIVGVHDRGEYQDRLWISMDYIEGRYLEQAIKQEGPFAYPRALNIIRGVALALTDLHNNQLMHRDVKPANILLARQGGEEKAYLTDFGIARELADQLGLTAASNSATMSVPYASPERLSLPSFQLDRRVDVYGLGCVMYEMLTARRAFPATDMNQLFHAVVDEYPPPPSRLVPNLPPGIDDVIFRALAKNRDQRYQDCLEFVSALDALPGTTIEATKRVPSPQPPLTLVYRRDGKPPLQADSERLASYDRERLLRAVDQSAFFQLDPVLPSQDWRGGREELQLTAINGAKSVSWQGSPPPPVSPLCQVLDELTPKSRSKKPWIIAGAGAAVVAAAVALILVFALKSSPPAIPDAPTNLASASQAGAIRVSWTPPTKNVDHYLVYRDNKQVNANVRTNFYVDRVNDTNKHSYAVTTVSSHNKVSGRSATVTGTANLRNLNAAETRFVATLPAGVIDRSSCTPATGVENDKIDVAVDCDLLAGSAESGAVLPESTLAYHNVNKAAYDDDVSSGESGLSTGSCQNGASKSGWSQGGVHEGAIYCFIGSSSKRPILGWSYDTQRSTIWVFGTANTGTSGIKALYKYWINSPSLSLS
jgi:serine/threonine protein kinase